MMTNNMDKLNARLERLEQRKNELAKEEKMVKKQMADQERKERTHRLCARGGMLESHLSNLETWTDDEVSMLLKSIFNLPEVIVLLNRHWSNASAESTPKAEEDLYSDALDLSEYEVIDEENEDVEF